MDANDFPMMRAEAERNNRLARFDATIAKIDQAVTQGSIRNVDYNDFKDFLSNLVNSTYEEHVSKPYYWGKGKEMGEDLYQLSWDVRVSGLHSVLASAKKLEKTKLDGEIVQAMKAVINEILPLTIAMKELKPKIVKGRLPREEPVPVNPNKVVRTCPCCFGGYAVQSNRMVHHGYTRPGDGYQTASCFGIRFKPLERSNEGLLAMIRSCEKEITRLKDRLEHPEKIDSLSYRKRAENHSGYVDAYAKPGDENFPRLLDEHLRRLPGMIRQQESNLAFFNDKNANWKQTEADPENPNGFIAEEVADAPVPRS